ncbi:MAG: GNAT family N-acetyltransferase [Gammaproteobacteria bacterium]|nr:GNAT family N-acetyltransferase [Gammaproteobacteria bacterium]
MSSRNDIDRQFGETLVNWTPPPKPSKSPLIGRYARLEPLRADHSPALLNANRQDQAGLMWSYLPYGPFDTLDNYQAWVSAAAKSDDPLFFAIVDQTTEDAIGVASYLRIEPNNGAIEVGHIAYSPLLQRSRMATEAMFLMMQNAFALGYRRYEWKCDSLNMPSVNAAKRLGFQYEGTFRQATVYKGRNRDTSWFSIIDQDWHHMEAEYRRYLQPSNFDPEGQQLTPLSL